LALNISTGLVVHPEVIARNVAEAMPYMATENILMAAVAKGGDRQMIHERIRQHSHAVTTQLKAAGQRNDLIDRLRDDPAFAQVEFDQVMQQGNFVGRAPQQVDEFIEQEITPLRQRYPQVSNLVEDIQV
jgi:adenylosuccinate lyase